MAAEAEIARLRTELEGGVHDGDAGPEG
jgi:hypothetical protein